MTKVKTNTPSPIHFLNVISYTYHCCGRAGKTRMIFCCCSSSINVRGEEVILNNIYILIGIPNCFH